MNWFFIALGAPFLWAIVNIGDNYLIARFSQKEKERSSGGLVLFSSLIGIIISFVIWFFVPDVFKIPLLDKLLLSVCGILTAVWIILYLFTLEIEEASAVVPWFLSVPVLGYILGYFFLGEILTTHQLVGSGIVICGLVLISLDFREGRKKLKHKPMTYMLFACLALAISGVIFKYVTIDERFWVSSFWEYLGLGISGLVIFLFIPHYRESFIHMNKTGGYTILMVNIVSEFLSISAGLLTNFAILLAPISMVYLVGNLQPVIVLSLTIFCTFFFPQIIKEDLSKNVLLPKILAILIIVAGGMFLLF